MSPVSTFSNLKAKYMILDSIPGRWKVLFSSSKRQQRVQLNGCREPFLLWVKRAGRQVHCSPPSSAKVKERVAPKPSYACVSSWHRQGKLYPYLTGRPKSDYQARYGIVVIRYIKIAHFSVQCAGGD